MEQRPIVKQYALPGRVVAARQSDVRPQVDGIITRRLFEEGSEVVKGQQLFQIVDSRYEAVLKSALADLHGAQANLIAVKASVERSGELAKNNLVSRQAYDDKVASLGVAQAAIGIAQAKVDQARINLEYTKVSAPISGRISRSLVSEGALVTANQSRELATITALSPMYVDMQQSAGDPTVMNLHAKLAGNAAIPVHLMLGRGGDGNRYAHTGQLKFSEVTIDRSTGSFTLRAEFPNPDGYLFPGMFVRAMLDLGEEQVLLVPQRATTRTALGELQVWVVDDEGKAQHRTIQAESTYHDGWIVVSGLKAGEMVIIEGYQKVRNGQQVRTVAWQAKPAQKLAGAGGT
ncbi:MAG: efflux RND transporter periplasmic adaptor subunit [Magnetococcales bacterium]|nr:efflux RND transporter periplasmic adaptor subunit [Magnetococcales bacterium]